MKKKYFNISRSPTLDIIHTINSPTLSMKRICCGLILSLVYILSYFVSGYGKYYLLTEN